MCVCVSFFFIDDDVHLVKAFRFISPKWYAFLFPLSSLSFLLSFCLLCFRVFLLRRVVAVVGGERWFFFFLLYRKSLEELSVGKKGVFFRL